MLELEEDYFLIRSEQSQGDEYYFWNDIIRMGYFRQQEYAYYYGRTEAAEENRWLIFEYADGSYLKVHQNEPFWDVFTAQVHHFLKIKDKDWAKGIGDAQPNEFVEVYAK